MDGDGLDAIVINASGCGTTVKDYGFMLRDRSGLCAKGGRGSQTLTRDISEYLAILAARHADRARRADRRLSRRLFAAAWPADRRAAEGAADASRLRREGHSRRDISAAARPGLTIYCKARLRETLRDRKIANIVQLESRRDRGRQYRLHHSDCVGHGDTGGPPGRVDRLGHGRPEAGGIVRRYACGAGSKRDGGDGKDVSSCLEAA